MIIREKTSDARPNHGWEIVIKASLNQRSFTYQATGSDGRTQIALYGTRVSSIYPFAELKAALIGLRDVFEWARHLGGLEKKISVPREAYDFFWGHRPCLPELKGLRNQLLKLYLALKNVTLVPINLDNAAGEGGIAA